MSRKTLGNMVLRVSRLAGDTSSDGKARAKDFLNDAQEFIQDERNWSFLREVEEEITLEAGKDTYDTPSGMYQISKVYYTDSNNILSRILTPCTDEDWVKYYEGRSSGNPSVYRLFGMDSTNYQLQIQIGIPPSANHISVFGSELYIEQEGTLAALTTDSQYSGLPGRFTKCLEYMGAALMCQSQGDRYIAQAAGYMTTYSILIKKLKLKDAMRYGKMFNLKGTGPNSWRGRGRTDYGRRI